MQEMDLGEIVGRLVGPVSATGDSAEDARRLVNLHNLIELVDELVSDINFAARAAGDHRASMNKIGMVAAEYGAALRAGDRP